MPGPRERRGRRAAPRAVALVLAVLTVLAVLAGAAWVTGAAASPAQPRAGAGEPSEPRFGWPLSPVPRVTRPFQAPAHPYGPGHRGVDLAAGPGREVLAAGQGFVVFAGRVAGRGVVSVDHDGGLRTTYEPVEPAVTRGEQVYAGQVVGTLTAGHAGCPVAACLHWGVRRGEEYLDPMRLVRVDVRIRLKPWEGVPPGG
ncbi:peptidase M23-like protein [Prauserella shujinwangii]|uniref:Peptidase M23-like protein n=1 Tax=Prauserella shujinwangii TaxID=1453103 RepID=A0A2T0LWL3_9PSEU|nr:M23 family metallopeptidase [Prauserella shujinwangii]PRX48404.1 peptidase M23-like protein [Prauserella shujinwangii]